MKKIILCEGKTDAILISYFLEKFNWQYLKGERPINITYDKNNELLNWYKHPDKPDQELAIWGVGGYDKIQPKLEIVVKSIQGKRRIQKRFNTIVLFADNDTGESKKHISDIDEWLKKSKINLLDKIQLQEWLNAEVSLLITKKNNEINLSEISSLDKINPLDKIQLQERLNAEVELLGNQQKYPIKLLSIILPPESKGNLEVFLLNALKENSDDERILVEEAKKFINKIPKETYLVKDRLKVKAQLGSVLSVMSPDWVFTSLDERLKKVNWEKLELVFTAYQKLRDL